jgi:RimJ/RimL family protein N-acetyltransferase
MAVALSEPHAFRFRPHHTARERTRDWRSGLPVFASGGVTLREMREADALPLLAVVQDDEVSKFLAPPPETEAGFREFIHWTHLKRAEGTYACFAIVPQGTDAAAGFFQLRALENAFTTAEWGFALGRAHWGTGLFTKGAEQLLRFAFEHAGVQRLEARAMAGNVRGNGALRKMGALREGILREGFARDGARHDTYLWSILVDEWRAKQQAQPLRLVQSR